MSSVAEFTTVAGLKPLLAMLDSLSPAGLRELERVLSARLHVERTPAVERASKLGALIELQRAEGQRPARKAYDQARPAGSLSSRRLVEIHGSWVRACRAGVSEAESQGIELAPSGGRASSGNDLRPLRSWANPTRARRRPAAYERDEVIQAILACAAEIGRVPTSNAYYDWAAQKRRIARRQSGAPPPRIPTQRSVERHFAAWHEVREAAQERMRRQSADTKQIRPLQRIPMLVAGPV